MKMKKKIIDRYDIKNKVLNLAEELDNVRQIRRIIMEAFSNTLVGELL